MFFKRGNIWWIKFKSRGEPVRESTGETDRGRAEIEGARIRLRYHKGEARPPRGQRATLAQLSAADIARAEGERVTEEQLGALRYLWRFPLQHLGPDSDPADVDYGKLEELVGYVRAQGLKGQSIRRVVQCMKRGLRIAVRRGWIDKLPADWPRLKSDPPDRKRAGKWVPPEVIRDWLDAMDPLARLHALGVVSTGIRDAEFWKGDLDWISDPDPGTDAVAAVRIPGEGAKTRKGRPIPLDTDTAELLLTYWGYPDRPRSHRRARETARISIGYHQTITLRDLRHVFGTLAEMVDRKAAQDLLGHATERMTQRYLHSDSTRLAATSASVRASLGVGGTLEGGTMRDGSEKSGGRRGFRTPGILRVRLDTPRQYSNLRSISDKIDDRASLVDSDQGAQRGHSAARHR